MIAAGRSSIFWLVFRLAREGFVYRARRDKRGGFLARVNKWEISSLYSSFTEYSVQSIDLLDLRRVNVITSYLEI